MSKKVFLLIPSARFHIKLVYIIYTYIYRDFLKIYICTNLIAIYKLYFPCPCFSQSCFFLDFRLFGMCRFYLARCEDETYSAIKERCLKQKLSISLKRLNSKAYAPTSTEPPVEPIANCCLPDGRAFAVGDVVWGKLQGCPWWPGKVSSILIYFIYRYSKWEAFKFLIVVPL